MPLNQHRPKYIEVYTFLRLLIERQGTQEGTTLPTEQELCIKFHCSRSTVRKAFDILTSQGNILRRQGSGSYTLSTDRSTLTKNTRVFAVMVPNMANNPTLRFVNTLTDYAVARNVSILAWVTNDLPNLEREATEQIAHQRVNGVIKFATNPEIEEETLDRFRFYGIPCVVINQFWRKVTKAPHICHDERACVKMAVDHLVKLGHRRLALIDSDGWPRIGLIDEFKRQLRIHKLPHEEEHLLLCNCRKVPLRERLYSRNGPCPTGIITAYDISTANVLSQLKDAGLRVPEDVSVVNLNGHSITPIKPQVELTACIPPHKEMAERAFTLLEVASEQMPAIEFMHTPTFHIGNTTAPYVRPVKLTNDFQSPDDSATRKEVLAETGSETW